MKFLPKYEALIGRICSRQRIGKKKLQKLCYLIERRGVDLHLDYSIHFYGPYSEKLDTALHILDSNGVLKIDTSGATHVIKISSGYKARYAVNVLEGGFTESENQEVDFVLTKFGGRKPMDLEAITTLDYVAKVLVRGNREDKDIVKKVKEIKGDKFTDPVLFKDLQILKDYGYIHGN